MKLFSNERVSAGELTGVVTGKKHTARRAVAVIVVALAMTAGAVGSGKAQDAKDFYKGKQLTVYVGFGAGGGYDLYARLVAGHLGPHLPGRPSVVVQNKPGGAGLVLANYLYSAAKKDGTDLGVINQTAGVSQRLGYQGVMYDVSKLNWIGRMTKGIEAVTVWHSAGVKTVEGAKAEEVVMGATGTAGTSAMYPRLLNNLLGTKFKVVTGYKGMSSTWIAMEQGEVEGGSNSLAALRSRKAQWLKEGKLLLLAQVGLEREPDFPDTPLLFELADNDLDRAVLRVFSTPPSIGRALTAPPGIPAERVKLLRSAFEEAMKDPKLLSEAKRLRADVEPLPGDELQTMVENSIDISDEVAKRAIEAVKP